MASNETMPAFFPSTTTLTPHRHHHHHDTDGDLYLDADDCYDPTAASSPTATTDEEGPGARSGRWVGSRERWLERTWEMRRTGGGSPPNGCRVLVRPRGKSSGRRMQMDMDEVKACRELGLGLPRDWTVEITGGSEVVGSPESGSGGTSPISSWRISSPGDDPREIKARLKVWAHAVAIASASRLSG